MGSILDSNNARRRALYRQLARFCHRRAHEQYYLHVRFHKTQRGRSRHLSLRDNPTARGVARLPKMEDWSFSCRFVQHLWLQLESMDTDCGTLPRLPPPPPQDTSTDGRRSFVLCRFKFYGGSPLRLRVPSLVFFPILLHLLFDAVKLKADLAAFISKNTVPLISKQAEKKKAGLASMVIIGAHVGLALLYKFMFFG